MLGYRMLVEYHVAALLPGLWIARRVKAAEHDGIIGVKVVEQRVRGSGDEGPTSRAIQDWLPFRVAPDQVEGSGHRAGIGSEVPGWLTVSCSSRIGKVSLGLRGEPNVHSCASMRARTSSHELSGGGLTAY